MHLIRNFRLILNLKKIPYKTVWLTYESITPTLQSLGFEPTYVGQDGSPRYTCPAIQNPNYSEDSPIQLVDSLAIARYLDINYPSSLPLFPINPSEEVEERINIIDSTVTDLLDPLVMPLTPSILSEPAASYYTSSKPDCFDKPWDQVSPAQSPEREAQWKLVENGLDQLATMFDQANASNSENVLYGRSISQPSFVDVFLAGYFLWTEQMPTARDGPSDKCVFDVIKHTRSGDRWERFLRAFDDFRSVDHESSRE